MAQFKLEVSPQELELTLDEEEGLIGIGPYFAIPAAEITITSNGEALQWQTYPESQVFSDRVTTYTLEDLHAALYSEGSCMQLAGFEPTPGQVPVLRLGEGSLQIIPACVDSRGRIVLDPPTLFMINFNYLEPHDSSGNIRSRIAPLLGLSQNPIRINFHGYTEDVSRWRPAI